MQRTRRRNQFYSLLSQRTRLARFLRRRLLRTRLSPRRIQDRDRAVKSPTRAEAARSSGPDRIYFDIEGAKIASELLHNQIDVEHGGFLKTVRVAQNKSGVARIVLEVNGVKDYSVFLLPNPYRLVVDVYGTSAAAEQAALATAPPPGPTTEIPPLKTEKQGKEAAAKTLPKIAGKTSAMPVTVSPGNTESARIETLLAPASGPLPEAQTTAK